jgi:hypothetical protein
MRNVIFAINITIDGCCDHTKVIGYTQLMREGDLQVFGRKTYELMVPYWPDVAKSQSHTKASVEFARTFDSINKIFFSRSLDSASGYVLTPPPKLIWVQGTLPGDQPGTKGFRRGAILAHRPVLRRKRAPETDRDTTCRTRYDVGKVRDTRRFAVDL